jgi:hypothetical protein
MSMRIWLSAVMSGVIGAATLSGGCGQDVATCGTVCELPNADADTCSETCSEWQSVGSEPGYGGDFQALLTCLSNAGDYDAVTGVCASFVAALDADERGGPISDSGASDSASSTSCANATCVSVCAKTDAAASCTSQCEIAAATCPASAAGVFQAVLTCVCSAGIGTATTGTACANQLQAYESECPSLMELEAGIGISPGGLGR